MACVEQPGKQTKGGKKHFLAIFRRADVLDAGSSRSTPLTAPVSHLASRRNAQRKYSANVISHH